MIPTFSNQAGVLGSQPPGPVAYAGDAGSVRLWRDDSEYVRAASRGALFSILVLAFCTPLVRHCSAYRRYDSAVQLVRSTGTN